MRPSAERSRPDLSLMRLALPALSAPAVPVAPRRAASVCASPVYYVPAHLRDRLAPRASRLRPPARPRASTRPHSGAELDKRAAALPDERREREARKHAKVQAQFLRLRRTKIGLADFRTVKVIGRGAFGEVRPALFVLLRACGAERGVVRGAFFRCAWCRRRIRGGCMR